MTAAQISPGQPARDRARHLRITVQIEEARLELVSAIVVNQPLDVPKTIVGVWVYEWREDGETVWWDTMPDPFAERGIARPKEYEHSFGQRRRGDFTIRVPIDSDAARRRLEDYARRQRGAVKSHEETHRARVSRLFPEAGYGFLETPDGREIYFHRHSVLHPGFDRLAVGTEVRFVEEAGEKGPQASTVAIASIPGL